MTVGGDWRERAATQRPSAAIGHGVHSRPLDVPMPSSIAAALDDVAVVSRIDQLERGLLHAAIELRLRYTDITPHLVELGRAAAYEQLDAAARASGSLVLLGAGLVPGISNVTVVPSQAGPAGAGHGRRAAGAADADGGVGGRAERPQGQAQP